MDTSPIPTMPRPLSVCTRLTIALLALLTHSLALTIVMGLFVTRLATRPLWHALVWTLLLVGWTITIICLFCHASDLPHVMISLSNHLACPRNPHAPHHPLLLPNCALSTLPPHENPLTLECLYSRMIRQHSSPIVTPMTQQHQYPTMTPQHERGTNGKRAGHENQYHPLCRDLNSAS